MEFNNAKVIIQKRKNGLEPAIFIVENDNVNMITITPDHNFIITNEGPIGARYDENGNWVGNSDSNFTINCKSTYFMKICGKNSRIADWVECILQPISESPYCSSFDVIPCDENYKVTRNVHLVNFEDLMFDGKLIENVDNKYFINTYECYEHLCGGVYLHHSAHFIDKK